MNNTLTQKFYYQLTQLFSFFYFTLYRLLMFQTACKLKNFSFFFNWSFKKEKLFFNFFNSHIYYNFFFISSGIVTKKLLVGKKFKKSLKIKYKQIQAFIPLFQLLRSLRLMLIFKGNPLKLELLFSYFKKLIKKFQLTNLQISFFFFKTFYNSFLWLTKKAKLKRKLRRKILKHNQLTYF